MLNKKIFIIGVLMVASLVLTGCEEDETPMFIINKVGGGLTLSNICPSDGSFCHLVNDDNIVYYNYTDTNDTVYWRIET